MHALKPSFHVWSNLASICFAQFSNQAPPRPQQLDSPSLVIPHLGHPEVVAPTARVGKTSIATIVLQGIDECKLAMNFS